MANDQQTVDNDNSCIFKCLRSKPQIVTASMPKDCVLYYGLKL